MSNMTQVVEVLEAERSELAKQVEWLDEKLVEFRQHANGAIAQPPRRRITSSRRRAPRNGNAAAMIVAYLRDHPGSTAGEVASALDLKRNSVSTRLAAMCKAGEIVKAERGYSAG